MKIGIHTLAILLSCTASVSAFAPSSIKSSTASSSSTSHSFALNAERNSNNVTSKQQSLPDQVKAIMASTFMAAALWASPPAALFNTLDGSSSSSNMMNEIRTTIVADAKEMASGSGSRVNKDPESLLRYGLPIPKDKEVSSL